METSKVSSTYHKAPRVALRFDVDTYKCMHHGVPRLLELADEYQVPMTFFINMGRALSYPSLLRKVLARRLYRERIPESAPKLSSLQKLKLPGTLYTLVANPRVGLSSRLLPNIESRGHEIGLHGGRNHASWQNQAHLWTEQELNREIDWGLRALNNAGIPMVSSFASPGWNSPAALPTLLANKGFSVLADHHRCEDDACQLTRNSSQITSINTNLAGEPGGIGYLESCQARKLGFDEMASEAEALLQRYGNVVMYDHPVYAGDHGFSRLKALIKILRHHNSRFLTVTHMARECAHDAIK